MRNFNQEELTVLSAEFESQPPTKILEWVGESFQIGEVGMATGFGAEGVALIDMIASINKNIPIFFLDTDVLFPETYTLRDKLEEKYSIHLIRYATHVSLERQSELHGPNLWETNPDICCNIRKVEPLREALKNYSGWMTAIRRDQSVTRANAGIIEWDHKFDLLKINPLAVWTKKEVWKYIVDHEVPFNPLYDNGYASIGCTHCTTPVAADEDERAGRWRGFQKKECGLHVEVQNYIETQDFASHQKRNNA